MVLRELVAALATPRRYLAEMQQFYDTLLDGANNRIAADALRVMHVRVSQLGARSARWRGRFDGSVYEIGRIVDAIRIADEDAAWTHSVDTFNRPRA
jgi:DNA-binding GntR family transcriptional regulator